MTDLVRRSDVIKLIHDIVTDATDHGISPRLDPEYLVEGIAYAVPSALDDYSVYKVSSVFQNYYRMGLSEIAEDDETCARLFKGLGLL